MIDELQPGDRILLDDQPAEVIRTERMGELPYVRAYIEGVGPKTVCTEHVTIEHRPSGPERVAGLPIQELHPGHEAVSAERFDVQMQGLRLRLAHEHGQLLSLSQSLVRLEPYQLACVNDVMRKLRQRVLIADDVGLGKTIEAGLILKELEARRRADRVLFVVPAHLQKKWIRDMDRFFDIQLTMADRTWVEGERRRLGEAANIWDQDQQTLITSMAFLRQDEFEQPLEDAFWDVVIVDECHKASKRGDDPSDTSRRVEQVAHQSDSLLLLSATPHDGKEDAFRSLVSYIDPFVVVPEEELDRGTVERLMIRRGKETIFDDEGERVFPERDVTTVPVEMTAKEKDFYDAVTTYVREIYNRSSQLNEPVVGFAMALMQKRLVSSIGAIQATLRRRLSNLLEVDELALSQESQAYLDGDDLDEEDKERVEEELACVTVPGSDAELDQEIQVLHKLVDQAGNIPIDTKAEKVQQFIQNLLEEQPEEKVLLFTEYTDTLEYLLDLFEDEPWSDEILVIHGDVDKEDRTRIEDEFNYGRSRILLATDAASEGIDLQESCHIMVNYELPWNPNRLEQRIGRIHRYGQDKEVKVWNFQFDGTREAEIFELLEQKIENIRSKVGTTADVLGMMENLDVSSILMESMKDRKPPSATREEFEELIEEREQTMLEWFDRSLVDCSTFDAESRQKIQEVVDESEELFGSEEDVEEFVRRAIQLLGGDLERKGRGTYEMDLPETTERSLDGSVVPGTITFDRELAMNQEELDYCAPDSPLVGRLIDLLLSEAEDDRLGLKVLPFLEQPGMAFVYQIAFEDGTGEALKEELLPLFVGLEDRDPHPGKGDRILDAQTVKARPDTGLIKDILSAQGDLREAAEGYLSTYVQQTQTELLEERQEATDRELDHLENYAQAERERLEEFIRSYQERKKRGEEMDISIRRQEHRLEELEDRIEDREENIRKKGQVISIAPEEVGLCFAVPG